MQQPITYEALQAVISGIESPPPKGKRRKELLDALLLERFGTCTSFRNESGEEVYSPIKLYDDWTGV